MRIDTIASEYERHPVKFALLTLCIIALFPILSASAAGDRVKPAYMPLGPSMVPPFGFIRFCVSKPKRCPLSEEIQRIPLNPKNRRILEDVQHSVNSQLRAGLERWNDGVTRTDCTDYALTKRSRLLDMGYPPSALLIAVAFVLNGQAHLLLVVVTNQGDFVLDNLRPMMMRWDQLPYRWVMRSRPQDPKKWQAVLPLYTGPGFEKFEISPCG